MMWDGNNNKKGIYLSWNLLADGLAVWQSCFVHRMQGDRMTTLQLRPIYILIRLHIIYYYFIKISTQTNIEIFVCCIVYHVENIIFHIAPSRYVVKNLGWGGTQRHFFNPLVYFVDTGSYSPQKCFQFSKVVHLCADNLYALCKAINITKQRENWLRLSAADSIINLHLQIIGTIPLNSLWPPILTCHPYSWIEYTA